MEPFTRMEPLVGTMMPEMAFSRVLFPAPLVPTMPSICPFYREKVMFLSAQNSCT